MWCFRGLGVKNVVLFCLALNAIWDGVVFDYAYGAENQKDTFPRAANTTQVKPTSGYNAINLQPDRRRNKGNILNLSCVGIRTRRYVSDGFCTSAKAIRDMICEGQCMPMEDLPWFPTYTKLLSRKKQGWHCVNDQLRTRKVKVYCNDGSSKVYRVRVVRSCKCKDYKTQYNRVRYPMDPE